MNNKLKRIMKEWGLNAFQLSLLSKVREGQIFLYMRGTTPTLEIALKIFNALNTKGKVLFEEIWYLDNEPTL